MWAFWRGRIHARRRVVNLACSCSGEARLYRIDLIREDASDPLATRSRDDDAAIVLFNQRAQEGVTGAGNAHFPGTLRPYAVDGPLPFECPWRGDFPH